MSMGKWFGSAKEGCGACHREHLHGRTNPREPPCLCSGSGVCEQDLFSTMKTDVEEAPVMGRAPWCSPQTWRPHGHMATLPVYGRQCPSASPPAEGRGVQRQDPSQPALGAGTQQRQQPLPPAKQDLPQVSAPGGPRRGLRCAVGRREVGPEHRSWAGPQGVAAWGMAVSPVPREPSSTVSMLRFYLVHMWGLPCPRQRGHRRNLLWARCGCLMVWRRRGAPAPQPWGGHRVSHKPSGNPSWSGKVSSLVPPGFPVGNERLSVPQNTRRPWLLLFHKCHQIIYKWLFVMPCKNDLLKILERKGGDKQTYFLSYSYLPDKMQSQ